MIKEILNAIYNHTIIDSRDKLSLILYLADKREPLRNINDDILDIAKIDLKKAYKYGISARNYMYNYGENLLRLGFDNFYVGNENGVELGALFDEFWQYALKSKFILYLSIKPNQLYPALFCIAYHAVNVYVVFGLRISYL